MTPGGRGRIGTFDPITEISQLFYGRRNGGWTPLEKRVLWDNPELCSADLARLLPGRSPKAVRNARMRFGRYGSRSMDGVCSACDERPVWSESPRARRMGLCKGCFLREMEQRAAEEARANKLRQDEYKNRTGGPRGDRR